MVLSFAKTIEDYQAVEASYNIRWVGNALPARTTEKTRWLCPEGHISTNSYSKIVNDGVGCNICNPPPLSKTADDYHALAEWADIQWVGDAVPQRVTHKTLWYSAGRKTEFKDTYQQVQRRGEGKGSHYRIRRTSEDYFNLGDERNIEWMSEIAPRQSPSIPIGNVVSVVINFRLHTIAYPKVRRIVGVPTALDLRHSYSKIISQLKNNGAKSGLVKNCPIAVKSKRCGSAKTVISMKPHTTQSNMGMGVPNVCWSSTAQKPHNVSLI